MDRNCFDLWNCRTQVAIDCSMMGRIAVAVAGTKAGNLEVDWPEERTTEVPDELMEFD